MTSPQHGRHWTEESERYFSLTPDLLCIADAGGRFVRLNPSWRDVLGYELSELEGRAYIELVHPEDRAATAEATACLAQGGVILNFVNRYQHKDGSYRWIEWRSTGDASGLIHAAARDVTERKRAADDLARAQALLVAAIEQSPAGILIADAPSNRVRLANSAALGFALATQARPEDVPDEIHRQSWRAFHPDGTPYSFEELPLSRAVWHGETVRSEEALIRRADGEERWILANAAPVRDAAGQIVAGVVVCPDITDIRKAAEERQRLQAQVQHVQKLESLGVLAGGIAHDFNNMLMAILGNANLAARGLAPDSRLAGYLGAIETASLRAAELCRQLLAYSGRGRFVIELLSVNDLVREMTRMLEVSISKGVKLRFELAADLPAIEADATQVRQVLMNLITNASEAIGERGGVVTITTDVLRCDPAALPGTYLADELGEGTFVTVEVSDSGCGMTPEVQARLFDPFFTTKFTGRGLGMAAVLGIVRGHRGAIRIDTEPGRGTTIGILLPASERQLARGPAGPEAASPWEGRGTVLLADDEAAVREVSADMLRMMGFEVLLADDGAAALELFRVHRAAIRCVVLDTTMPRMGGVEALAELRRLDPGVRVVLASGYGEQDVAGRVPAGEPVRVLEKPFAFETLRARLREALG